MASNLIGEWLALKPVWANDVLRENALFLDTRIPLRAMCVLYFTPSALLAAGVFYWWSLFLNWQKKVAALSAPGDHPVTPH